MTRKASFVYKYLYQTEKKMWQEKKKQKKNLGACLNLHQMKSEGRCEKPKNVLNKQTSSPHFRFDTLTGKTNDSVPGKTRTRDAPHILPGQAN